MSFRLRNVELEVDLERTAQLRSLYSVMCEVNDVTPKNVRVFCFSRHSNAYAYTPERIVSVSRYFFRAETGKIWAPKVSAWIDIPPRTGFTVYALAHELAHIAVFDEHRSVYYKDKDGHGTVFMEYLKALCPEEYQHWEYEYKPESAFSAGVNTDKAEI